MRETRKACEGKGQLRKSWHRLADNIKIYIVEIGWNLVPTSTLSCLALGNYCRQCIVGSLVTTAGHILVLRMNEMASSYRG
jgi:hypothetical protein